MPTVDPPLLLVERLPVLGVPTTFETDSEAVLKRVRVTWGRWARLPPSAPISEREARIRLTVSPPVGPGRTTYTHHASSARRLRVEGSDGGAHGEALPDRGEAAGVVPADRIAPGTGFVRGLLEPLTLFVLGGLDRQPVHAACVVRDGVGLLLAGPSGTGKSTVAHASRAAGFSVLADEPVYVQLEPGLSVWGRGSRIHLTPAAREGFPDLAGLAPTRLPTGKIKVVVPGRDDDPFFARRVGLCVLDRGAPGTAPSLERLPVDEAVGRLTTRLDPGFALFSRTIGARVAAVARSGAWILRWGGRPEDAVRLLERALAERGGRP